MKATKRDGTRRVRGALVTTAVTDPGFQKITRIKK